MKDERARDPEEAPREETVIESSILELRRSQLAPQPPRPAPRPLPVGRLLGVGAVVVAGALGLLYALQREQARERARTGFLELAGRDPEAALAAADELPAELRAGADVQGALLEVRAAVEQRRARAAARELLDARAQDQDLAARVTRCEQAAARDPSWGAPLFALAAARWAEARARGVAPGEAARALEPVLAQARAGAEAAAPGVARAALALALAPGEPRRALEELARADEADPAGAWGALARGWRLQLLAQPEPAEAALDLALSRCPLLPALLLRGRLRLERRAADEALADAEAACALDPLSAEALCLRARARPRTGRGEAERDLERALALAPGLARARLARAELMVESAHEQAAARAEARAALAADPSLAAAHLVLARVALGEREPALARAALDQALRLGQPAEAWLLRGRLRREAGDANGASEDLAAALRRDPRGRDAAQELAAALAAAGRAREAREVAERLTRQAPGDPRGFLVLGELELETGRAKEAADAFSEALALDALNARARFGRALAYLALGRPLAAQPDLEALAADAPEPGARSWAQGLCHEALKEPERARAAYRASLRDAPTGPYSRRARARLDALGQ
ncbi:MAG: tetratricopeptide repeat protein [Planctomycetota bacterium]